MQLFEFEPVINEAVELASLLFWYSTSKNINLQSRLIFALNLDVRPVNPPITSNMIVDDWWLVVERLVLIGVQAYRIEKDPSRDA
jgi:hypothetical protein